MKPSHLAQIKLAIKHVFESFQEGHDPFIAFFYNRERKIISWITDTEGFKQRELHELDSIIAEMVNAKSMESDIYIYHCADNLELSIEDTPDSDAIDHYEISDTPHLYMIFD